MKKVSLPIIGMHCASCARLIEKKLIKTDGVIDANVNYASEIATVDFDQEKTNEEKLVKAVNETGYKAIHSTSDHGKTGDEIK